MANGYMAPIDIGRIFGRAWRGLARNLKDVLIGAIIVTLIMMALSVLQTIPFTGDDGFNPMEAQSEAGYWMIVVLVMVINYLLYAAWWVYVDRISFRTTTGRDISARTAAMRALKLMIPVLFLAIITGIVMYVGMIFFIVPGVFIAICWAVYAPAYISEENTGVFGALGRSWNLTSGRRLMVWVTGLIMMVILLALMFVSVGISMSAVGFNAVLDPSTSMQLTPAYYVTTAIGAFITILTMGFYASYTNALYVDLVETKEGGLDSQAVADVFS
jgi:hypothetical protein